MLLVVVNYEWEIVQTIPAVTFKLDETRWPRRGKILQAFQLMEPAKSHYSGLNNFFNFRFVYDYTVDYVSSRERANNS